MRPTILHQAFRRAVLTGLDQSIVDIAHSGHDSADERFGEKLARDRVSRHLTGAASERLVIHDPLALVVLGRIKTGHHAETVVERRDERDAQTIVQSQFARNLPGVLAIELEIMVGVVWQRVLVDLRVAQNSSPAMRSRRPSWCRPDY